MKLTSMAKAVAALVTALALSTIGLAVVAPKAAAHTPSVTATCSTLDVNLVNYQKGSPGSPATADQTVALHRYKWTGGQPGVGGPTTKPPGENWQLDNKPNSGTDVLGKAFQEAQGNNDSWFFWTTTVIQGSPAVAATTNHVTVTVNDVVKASDTFDTTWTDTFTVKAGDTYEVVVKAWDDLTGDKGWTKTFTGTIAACVVPVAATMNLTYMTGCAPDDTNTWRIRNGSTVAVPFTLEYYGKGVQATGTAAVGDTLINLPRMDATAILKWGGGTSGIIAGQVTKASGIDEVSDTCAGTQPASDVKYGEWVDGTWDCGATTVEQTRTVTSTPYVLKDHTWVLDTEGAKVTSETQTRNLTEVEIKASTDLGGRCYQQPTKPADIVESTNWVDGTVGCAATTVDQTRTTSTTTFTTWDSTKDEWTSLVSSKTERRTRALAPSEVCMNLTLTKTVTSEGPYFAPSQVTYQLAAHNDGPGKAAAGWSVTDTLPVGMTLVKISGDGYTCDGLTCTSLNALAANATSAPITVVAQILGDEKPGMLKNVANVSPAEGDIRETSVTDNGAQAVIEVKGPQVLDTVLTLPDTGTVPTLPNTGIVLTLPNTGASIPLTWLLAASGLVAAGVILLGASRFNTRGRKS